MFSLPARHNYCKGKLIGNKNVVLVFKASRSTIAERNDEYQYIKKSKTPTMHFQPSLPRLPIPKLEDSCKRYLNAQKPLLSNEQLDKTTSYVNEFLTKSGIDLQKKLIAKDVKNLHTSYISEPWFDMYLRDRKPLPINYNPFIVFAPEDNSLYNAQLVKATNLLISSLRFMKSLKENILPPEVFHLNPKKSDTDLFHTVTRLLPSRISWYGAYLFKAYPLDMSQYHNLFNTTRLPKIEKDEIYQNTSARHVIVMRKGHFYSIDVLDENGYIYEPKTIANCLKSILENNRPANECPIGVLTTAERNLWANTRTHLSEIGNQDLLKKIDSAVFMMILDDVCLGTDYNKLVGTFLHADGTNRWFDKSFSLIVTQDGYAGVNFEHSWGDGVAVLRFFNDVKNDISKQPRFHPNDVNYLQSGTSNVKQLKFVVDDKVQNIVDRQTKKYEEWTKQLSIDHVILEKFGKDECKTFGVSPDAIMQLAFQLALYYQDERSVATYESCSTAAFKHGRTETIRSCTMETKAVCDAMVRKNSNLSNSELKQLIINCSNVHNKLTKEAAMGQGFDRHLFALKKIWEQSSAPKPAIFEDPAYDNINHNILSTSTLSSPAVIAGGFGPVVNNGYGIGYMIQDKRLGSIVTSYNNHCNSTKYVKCLEQAFKNIYQVFVQ
ncbi:carnitine O-palmitoyltransferase 2, mitochondrial [Hylaeus anthracinus]|uniref:carnitine O-palmitoyltransferase 2, mitochondrial n=1 Tax=Hylaeus anthracinus TaxID=313031 RepID=UPI0023BA2FAB|nr:carnitine O-palmitoyltransferase 2, mitochondrial [Hylaeus anthracinus]